MLTLITKPEEIKGVVGEIRAGGTDLHDRYRLGVSSGPIIDIHKLPYTDITQNADGTTTIGAMATIDAVGQNPITANGYGALAKAANALADMVRDCKLAAPDGDLLGVPFVPDEYFDFRHSQDRVARLGDNTAVEASEERPF